MAKREFPPIEEQLAYLTKGAAETIRPEELRERLEQSAKTGKPLRAYLGVDPTAPDLHLGHTVVLRKLKHFQDMGHTAIFLIGDFSAMIGDPTGQSETRPPLTREQVDANAKTYLEQVYKILGREKTEVRYNSEWLGKMTAEQIVRLCSHYRLARMLEREDFHTRLEKNLPISVHELLYPLLTAYDAVKLESDVELGATEQKFNLLVHREIQREYGLRAQVILTMPILVGLDGQRKMSKSYGNYVGISEPPRDMFGKLMSISDELMWSYWDLLTDLPPDGVANLRNEVAAGRLHPMDAKMRLATAIVSTFHGHAAGEEAAAEFHRVFRERQTPEEMTEYRAKLMGDGALMLTTGGAVRTVQTGRIPEAGSAKWARLLATWLEEVPSRSKAEDLIRGGGLEVNGTLITDPAAAVDLRRPGSYVVRLGKKKFLRIVIE